jgi:hypothetical protein
MGEGETIIAVLGILCGTGITVTFINMIKAAITGRGGKKQDAALLEEIRCLREETKQLSRQNNDVILALDTSMQRMDRRLQSLEGRAELPAGASSQASEETHVVLRRGG